MTALVIILAWLSAAVLAVFALVLMRDPKASLGKINHHFEDLPAAVFVRYVALTVLAVLLALIGNVAAITAMLAVFALQGFGDAWVYRSAGKPYIVHMFGGGAGAVGALIGLAALS